MGLTLELLPWIGGVALAAALLSIIWMAREAMAEAETLLRDSRARAAEARRAFKAGAQRERDGIEVEAGSR